MSRAHMVLLNSGVRNEVRRLRRPHGQQLALLVRETEYRAFPIDEGNQKVLGSVFQISHPSAIATRADSTLHKGLSRMLALLDHRAVVTTDDLLVKGLQRNAQVLQEPLGQNVLP